MLNRMPRLRFTMAAGHPANMQRAWILAAGAPLTAQDGHMLDALSQPDGPNAKTLRQRTALTLSRFWRVQDRDSLIATLNWLGREGHRVAHRMRVTDYSLGPLQAISERRRELKAAAEYDEDALAELYRIDVVLGDHNGIRKSHFLAFDAARAVSLVYAGRVHDWLSEDESWAYMVDMARDLQRTYESWESYAEDFLRARNFWHGSDIGGKDPVIHTVRKLLSAQHSPWRQQWEQPLPTAAQAARLRNGTSGAEKIQDEGLSGPSWWLERPGDGI